MLYMLADVSNSQMAKYCHNELCNTLFLAHVTTGEYVVCYVLLHYFRKYYCYVDNARLLTKILSTFKY